MRVGRAAIGASLVLTALVCSAASPRAASSQPASADTAAVRILEPRGTAVESGMVHGPPTSRAAAQLAYPDDGSVLTVASGTALAAVDTRHDVAQAAVDLTGINLFGGEITADEVSSRASASAHAGAATGSATGTVIKNLVVEGQLVQAAPGLQVPVGGWGQMALLGSRETPGTTFGVASFRETVAALALTLTAEHGGLPAGSRLEIATASAFARASLASKRVAPPPPQPTAPSSPPAQASAPQTSKGNTAGAGGPGPDASGTGVPRSVVLPVPEVAPQLTAKRYVFPIYGPVGYGDSFGAPRADTGWHHGDDLFAALGAPVLAVTDGTVFSVGWQPIGGNRFWLRDPRGNEFYYAHLSAFSPLAVNGTDVKAGDVIGFVGNSGDAEGTPYHLHFEIHPGSLLFLGYDGVVDPTPYLDAWRRLQDLRFPTGAAWAPAFAPTSHTPIPGAILLQSRDISSASGLDPVSLRRALAPVSAGEGGGTADDRTAAAPLYSPTGVPAR